MGYDWKTGGWTTQLTCESTALPNFGEAFRAMLETDIAYLRNKAAWMRNYAIPEAARYEAAAKALEGTP